MTPRPRKNGNKDLAGTNLYPKIVKGVTYYQWRDPRNGKYHGMGTDKAAAIRDARALMAAIYHEVSARKLDALVKSKKSPTMLEGVRIYWRVKERGKPLKPNTKRSRSYILDTVAAKLMPKKVDEVSVLDCSALLDEYTDQNKARMAQSVRSTMIDFFNVMAAQGYIRKTDNPAFSTLPPSVTVKRSRLAVDEFWTIYQHAQEPWLQNAMLLALVTGQRREDVSRMKFRDVKDGYLEVIQGKTNAGLRIGLGLTLEGWTLDQVIAKCRDRVLSPYMIHHAKDTTLGKKGDPLHKDTISRAFARARQASGLTWTKEPPTFHEIRSLSGRLHEKAGRDAKLILGHSDQKTTDMYLGTRGREWVEVG